MPDEVHQVGRVLAVVDGEGGIESDRIGIFAQQPGADAVERPGPGQPIRDHPRVLPQHLGGDAPDAARHLRRGPAGEGQQQYAARIGAVQDQMRHPVRQRVGLARAGAGDDEERRGDAPGAASAPCSTARRCSGFSFAR